MASPQFNVVSNEGLTELNNHFLVKSYITGFQASQDDLTVYLAFKKEPAAAEYPHLSRWFNHVKALLNSRFPGEAAGVVINNRPTKAQGGGDSKKEGKKGKGKGAEPKKEEAPKVSAADEAAKKAADEEKMKAKLLAKVVKEGGKKGVEIAGAADLGGLEYFCTTIESPDGDIELLKTALDSMNKEIDPNDEESKGGSGEVGKCIFSAGKEKLAIIAYGSTTGKGCEKINCAEWIKAITSSDSLKNVTFELVGEQSAKLASAYALGNSAKGVFPIKIKDDAMTAAFQHLRQNNAFPEDDDDDEDDYCYGDDAFDDAENW